MKNNLLLILALSLGVGVATAGEWLSDSHIYKQTGDRALHLYIEKPAAWKAGDQRPAIVFFFGGGWGSGSANQFKAQSEYLATLGMVGIRVEYRVIPKGDKSPPVVCCRDAKSAMRWVRAHAAELGIDPQRIAASGGSAGGHLAAFTTMVEGMDDPTDDVRISPKANALVLFNPVFDNGPEGGYGTARIGDRYKEFSPAHNITPATPPTVVFLGDTDHLISTNVLARFKANMSKAGVRCDTHVYAGQPHGFFNKEPYNSITLIETDKFLGSLGWLEGEPTLTQPAIGNAATAPVKQKSAGNKPNILILYADDMGYGDLGVNNPASKIPTPNLDRLAAGGLRFTDGHSSSGVCTPSRYAMLTGRHHWRDFHGIAKAYGGPVFKPGQLTLPAMLRRQGYATACIGKWHLGMDWDAIRKPGSPKNSIEYSDFDWTKRFPGGPVDHGFDYYFGDNVINFPPYAWIENDRLVAAPDMTFKKPPGNPKEGAWECRPGPGRSDWDWYQNLPTLTRKGVDYIRSRKGKEQSFFLYFPMPSPHAPIVPTDAFDGKSKAGAYGDYVVQTDDACGQLLAALRECGLESNTIVVFSSDNGPEHYAYARDEKFDHWSAAPFRGLKRDIYEGGHHVPFVIRWPGVTKAGTVTDALISQVDLMATFATLLDFDLPKNAAEDSHNFLPWLKGESKSPPRTTMVHNTNPKSYAIRDGDWLLVDAKSGYTSHKPPPAWNKKHQIGPADNQAVELYNLKNDIGQRHNLAAEHPEKVAELQALLTKLRDQGHSAPRLN